MRSSKPQTPNIDLRAAVQEEARRWVGTPYRHQHFLRGVGADCIGLIRGVGEAAGVLEVDREKARRFMNYTRLPNPRRMREALETFFVPAGADVEPGDFAWISWEDAPDLPMHLAILIEGPHGPRLIHSWAVPGKCVEHDFTLDWQARVVSFWRYPGLV